MALPKKRSLVFTGGGTGGHIFPGLAVADELSALTDLPLIWIGSTSGMEGKLVAKNPHISRFIGVPSGKLRRYFSLQNCIDVFKILAGFCASFFYLWHLKPVLVFSKGGFVSVPVCYAAKLFRIPLFTHECDFTPGLATRLNAKVAQKILLSFAETASFFSPSVQNRLVITGNPVRSVFYEASAKDGRIFLGLDKKNSAKPILFVCGGSSGARQINELVEENFDWLCEHYIVVHQTGAHFDCEKTDAKIKAGRADYFRFDFIYDEMPHVLAAADVVLSRAGANALWENAVTAKAMVLIPLAGAGTRGDQIDNAAFFAKHNAALVLPTTILAENLRQALTTMLDSDVRHAYAQAAASLSGGIKPAKIIAHLIKENIE